MHTKKIMLLAATLLILGLLYYSIEDPRGARKPAGPEEFVPDFDRDAAAAITITSPGGEPVTLTKKQAAWFVTADNQTWPADSGPADALLANVAGLKVDTVASRNPLNFEAFEVTEDTGVQVMIADDHGNIRAHFFVGKSGPDIFSTYIRSARSDSVVLTGGILKTVYDRQVSEWRDKTIFKLSADALVEYRISGDRELHLRRDAGAAWQLLAPEMFTPAPDPVAGALRQFAGLRAADFSGDNATLTGLDEPARTITARFADGASQALQVGREKNAFQTFVRPEGAGQVYVLENHVLEALCPPLEALRPEAGPPDGNGPAAAPDNDTARSAPGR